MTQDHKEPLDSKVKPGQQAHPALQVKRVQRAKQELRAQPAKRGHKGQPDQRGLTQLSLSITILQSIFLRHYQVGA